MVLVYFKIWGSYGTTYLAVFDVRPSMCLLSSPGLYGTGDARENVLTGRHARSADLAKETRGGHTVPFCEGDKEYLRTKSLAVAEDFDSLRGHVVKDRKDKDSFMDEK